MQKLQHQLNCLLTDEIARKIEYAKYFYFQNANKPTRWLAYKLRKEKEKKYIKSLKSEKGEENFLLKDLKKIAENFYRKLSRICQEEFNLKEINEFLIEQEQKKFLEDQKKILNEPIAVCELVEAIRKQKDKKTPGPDGIQAEFYKKI